MVQPIDLNSMKPVYNAVNINIKKPEINKSDHFEQYNVDDSIYNAVNIGIDNPSINTKSKNIYDYPEAKEPVTYEYANIIPANKPKSYHFAYQTTNLILPKFENEVDISDRTIDPENTNTPQIEEIEDDITIPEPNYTTTEAEKDLDISNETIETKNLNTPEFEEIDNEVTIAEPNDSRTETQFDINDKAVTNKLNFKGTDTVAKKKPIIIPSEEIKPDVDIQLTLNNLNSKDYDIQASQIEEIARLSLEDTKNVMPYIVRDVFTNLIDIIEKDTKDLTPPSQKQIDTRKKIIANNIAKDYAIKNNIKTKLPFEISQTDEYLAHELSPMEQAERNKTYALNTISILAKVYADKIEQQSGNIVPLTDLPGSAAIVNALRYSPNEEVKIAALDALMHIQRPEYKDELKVLYTLAAQDTNPLVVIIAQKALVNIDKI